MVRMCVYGFVCDNAQSRNISLRSGFAGGQFSYLLNITVCMHNHVCICAVLPFKLSAFNAFYAYVIYQARSLRLA